MNYTDLNGSTDPTQLENAYKGLVAKQNYSMSNPNAAPAGSDYFIPYGYHKSTLDPKNFTFNTGTGLGGSTAPYSGGGGKWICTELLKRGVITRKEFKQLVRAHALAIIRHPNFCFWYLKYAGKLVKEMNRSGFKWRSDGLEFYQSLFSIYETYGFEAGFQFYRLFCVKGWAKYLSDCPSPYSIKFGFFKFLKEKWLWKNLFNFEGVKS